MEFVDPGGDDMATGFTELLHRRDSQMEGMLASIAANLDLEPISRLVMAYSLKLMTISLISSNTLNQNDFFLFQIRSCQRYHFRSVWG